MNLRVLVGLSLALFVVPLSSAGTNDLLVGPTGPFAGTSGQESCGDGPFLGARICSSARWDALTPCVNQSGESCTYAECIRQELGPQCLEIACRDSAPQGGPVITTYNTAGLYDRTETPPLFAAPVVCQTVTVRIQGVYQSLGPHADGVTVSQLAIAQEYRNYAHRSQWDVVGGSVSSTATMINAPYTLDLHAFGTGEITLIRQARIYVGP